MVVASKHDQFSNAWFVSCPKDGEHIVVSHGQYKINVEPICFNKAFNLRQIILWYIIIYFNAVVQKAPFKHCL